MRDPITSETFPDREQVREMSHTQYGADPSSELEIPNNFRRQISEQNSWILTKFNSSKTFVSNQKV